MTGHDRKCEMCGRMFFYSPNDLTPKELSGDVLTFRCPACRATPKVDSSPIGSIGMRGGFSNGNISKGLRK